MHMTTTATVPFSLRIDPSTKAQLARVAKRADRTPSYLANKAIEFFLQAEITKEKAIEEAVKEANKGAFISSELMHKWFDSLGTDNELPIPEPDVFRNK